MKLLLCGLNGAGKSTLGRTLGKLSGWTFVDTEDYYFPTPGDYSHSRTKEEVEALLLRDLRAHENFIFTSVIGDFGPEVLSEFTHAVLVTVPRGPRLERVKNRTIKQFGRVTEEEQGFLAMVERRPEDLTEKWLAGQTLPVLRVDGTRPPEENAAYILKSLS